jgi:hypothetical protein
MANHTSFLKQILKANLLLKGFLLRILRILSSNKDPGIIDMCPNSSFCYLLSEITDIIWFKSFFCYVETVNIVT